MRIDKILGLGTASPLIDVLTRLCDVAEHYCDLRDFVRRGEEGDREAMLQARRYIAALKLLQAGQPTGQPTGRAPHGSVFRMSTDRREPRDGKLHHLRTVTQEPGEIVDEITLDGWLHLERMDVNEWHLSIGDARISVSVRHGCQPTVLVERGEYGPVHGDTRLLPSSHVEQRHDVVAAALVKAWNIRVEQGQVLAVVDGIEGQQRIRGAYLEGAIGREEAMVLLESSLNASASLCTPVLDDEPQV